MKSGSENGRVLCSYGRVLKILGASMWRSKMFENFPVALMSGSEILGASMWRPKIVEKFTAALMSDSEILLGAHRRILGAHELGLAGHGRVSGARGRG